MKFSSALILLAALAATPETRGHSDLLVRQENPDKKLVMDRMTVQRIFTKKVTRWSNGERITVFAKPLGSIEHLDFVTNVLGMTKYAYQEQLSSSKAKGIEPILEVSCDEDMARKVANTPGSIGYINYAIILEGQPITVIDGRDVN